MYLVLTESPALVDGGRVWLPAPTRCELVLLCESLEERLGPVTVLAPPLPPGAEPEDLVALERGDGVRVVTATACAQGPPGAFWLRERRRWRGEVEAWSRRARAVQAELGDMSRPLAFEGLREARRQDRPTVVVLAHDPSPGWEAEARGRGALARVGAQMLGAVFDGAARYAVGKAELALLAAGGPYRRFAEHARNPRAFHATTFRERDLAEPPRIEERLRARAANPAAPLRVACAGTVDRRLGVDEAIDAVRLARQRGTAALLDVIGQGDERRQLECRVASLGLRAVVRFLDLPPPGPARVRLLAEHDVLVFTADRLASPRPIFDGFAAGLPAVGWAHEDLRQRAEEDGAAVPLRAGDVDAVARALAELARDAERLAQLSRAAHRAARFHSADAWARRRAAWTLEAVEAHEAQARAGRRLAA